MRYYNLSKSTPNEYSNPVLIKVNSKTEKLLKRITKIIKKHRALEKQIIKELAKVNKMDNYDMDDLLADYDFLCDVMEYGNDNDGYAYMREITKKEYDDLKSKEKWIT